MYPYVHILGREIGTYGICMVIGFSTVFLLALHTGRPKGLILEDLLIVAACTLGCGLIGGCLLYVFVTYTPSEIWSFVLAGEWTFLGSGIVYYGGLIGGLAGAFLGIGIAGCNIGLVEVSVVPYIPLGHAIGRIGCVLAGCCYGFAYEGPLALYYPHSVAGVSPDQGYFPVQLLEAIINIGICIYLLWYRKRARYVMNTLFSYLAVYGVCRALLEFLRGDVARGLWFHFSTSQIISFLLLGISAMGFLYNRKKDVGII